MFVDISKRSLRLTLLALCVTAICVSGELLSVDEVDDVDGGHYCLSRSINHLGFEILPEESWNGTKNIIMSPFGSYLAIKLLHNITTEIVQSQIEENYKVDNVSFDDISQAMESYKKPDKTFILDIMTAFIVRQNLSLNPDFVRTLEDEMNSKIVEVDPKKAVDMTEMINDLAAKSTNNHIPRILDEPLSVDVKAMWLNAIHLSADWRLQFDEYRNKIREFYNIDGTVKNVTFMAMNTKFRAMPYEEGYIVEIPYRGDLAMYICTSKALPKNFDSLDMSEMKVKNIDLKMPKFSITYEMDLKQILTDQGIEAPFRTETALPGVSDFGLMIDAMKQNSKIDVDESGTRASAITSIAFSSRSLNIPKYITLDHPFFFVIRDTQSNINLFAGKVNKL